jgi:hypothetical protein
MWTASVWSQPWHCIGFLLRRQGQGAPQQQPMIREPAISNAGGVVAAGFVSAAHPADRSTRIAMNRFIFSSFVGFFENVTY